MKETFAWVKPEKEDGRITGLQFRVDEPDKEGDFHFIPMWKLEIMFRYFFNAMSKEEQENYMLLKGYEFVGGMLLAMPSGKGDNHEKNAGHSAVCG